MTPKELLEHRRQEARAREQKYRARHPDRVRQLGREKMRRMWAEDPEKMRAISRENAKKARERAKLLDVFDAVIANAHKFHVRVDKKLDDECWVWTGSFRANKNVPSYGVFIPTSGMKVVASRASYMIANNARLKKNQFICHKCDNPSCVNPNHLFAGEPKDNTHDMVAKGRWGGGRKAFKLTDEQVEEMRKDTRSNSTIGKHYGVSPSFVSMVKNDKRRKET
jgi:hypothetical protein